MWKFLLCLIVTTSQVLQTHGAQAGPLRDKYVATTIRDLCSYHDDIIFVGHFYLQDKDAIHLEIEKSLHEKTFEMGSIWSGTGGLSPDLYYMLNSQVFIQEMASCVPDEDQRNHLILKVIVADLAGQVTGFSQLGALIFGPGKVLKFIGERAYPIYLRFSNRFLGSMKPLSEKAFARIMEWTTNIASIAIMAYDTFFSGGNRPDVPADPERLKLLDARIQKVGALAGTNGVSADKLCAYKDFLYKTAQEYLELANQLGEENNVPKNYREILPCHTDDPYSTYDFIGVIY